MTSPLRRRLRQLRRGAWYAAAGLLVTMALAAGAVSQLLPLAERHPDRIAEWLSARAKRPVHFDHVETEWTRRGPLLRLDGLRIGDGADAVPIGAAEILVSQYAGLLPGRSFTELRLRGLELTLQRADDGRWTVRGLPSTPGSDPLAQLEGLGELQVIGGKLRVDAPAFGINARIPSIDVRLQVDGDDVRLGTRAAMRSGASTIEVRARFDRKRGNGRAYAVSEDVDLKVWTSLLHAGGIAATDGRGRLQAWADLREHRVVAVTVDAALRDIVLQGAPLGLATTAAPASAATAVTVPTPVSPVAPRAALPVTANGMATTNAPSAAPRVAPNATSAAAQTARFDLLRAVGRWQTIDSGWRLDVPTLRVGATAKPQVLDGLTVVGGARTVLLADRIDAGPLLAVAALSDRASPALRRWLLATRPDLRLGKVDVRGRAGALQASARIESFGFAAVGATPGVSGVAGTLQGDADGFAFAFDPAATARVDWPPALRAPRDLQMTGSLGGWRNDAGQWQVGTPSLRVQAGEVVATLRGGLTLDGDGTRPHLDLAADVDDFPIAAASGFWIRNMMPPATVRWLDTALRGGDVTDGHALIAGDLDDWPFLPADGGAPKGIFHATARLDDVEMKFQPGWPAANGLTGDVDFLADGFSFRGSGILADVAMDNVVGGIAHYKRAELTLSADTRADAAAQLALLRDSPLRAQYASTLDSLTARGAATSAFTLRVPFYERPIVPVIEGRIALSSVALADSRFDLAFDDVRGEATFDRAGFTADGLRARRGGQPGVLSLRAGKGHVRDAAQAFEAELAAPLTATELLDRAPDLAWLKTYFVGRSTWQVGVTIPTSGIAASAVNPVPARAATTVPARLTLRSDLVGTRLDLPAPMRKPAAEALATSVQTQIPFGGGDVVVAFGQRLALRARAANGRTGIRVVLGSSRVDEAPPAFGLVATGRAGDLDAIDWGTLATGGSGGASTVPLQRVDVLADRLKLLGGTFANVRLRAAPSGSGTAVQVEGAALAGNVALPRTSGAPITGAFSRVHWATPARATGRATAGVPDKVPVLAPAVAPVPPSPDAAADVDPSAIPPLQFTVDDLRFGEAALGRAVVRTQPIAGGLRIVELRSTADGQQVAVTGDWTGRGAAARTRLGADVTSGDFGKLLGGFGFGGRISGGAGDARVEASWPGSPAGFRLGALEGSLALTIKDGQLVEIEPGAGRVLGLLSVAELPRRLLLDFRDFFSKGFKFNRIGGTVRFAGGEARSDDMVIDGPAAEIRITGAADLRAQTFDQRIDVLPRSGNLLTVAGAIAGGPVGAAVGAVANAVLKKPLGEVGAKTYRVTGPWKDPKVEVGKREEADRPAAAQPSN